MYVSAPTYFGCLLRSVDKLISCVLQISSVNLLQSQNELMNLPKHMLKSFHFLCELVLQFEVNNIFLQIQFWSIDVLAGNLVCTTRESF